MHNNIKLILWDFGGVLTKSPLVKFTEYEKKHNLPSGTIIKINSHNKLNNAWAKLEKSLISKEEFSELFLKEARELKIKEKLDTNKILDCLNVELEPIVVDIFFELKKKITCACLTNNIRNNNNIISNNTFDSFKSNFSYVFESSKLGLRKDRKSVV